LGSTENSVVAISAAEMPEELIYVTSQLSEAAVGALATVAPNVTVVVVDGAAEAARYAGEAHGMDANLATAEFLAATPGLRWMQSWSAGVERYVRMRAVGARDELVLTNMAGMYGPVIAEHVFAMLLSRTRDLNHYLALSEEGRWDRQSGAAMGALQGRTMLVVGVGGIGSEIAARAHAFGMRVLGTVRTARPAPPYVDYLGTGDELADLLPQADVVVLAVPLTDETRHMIDAAALASMREGAWLVNIARGPVVETDALVRSLDQGHLGAAFLDVTDPEPLPSGHPLWGRDNVLITPHVAGNAELSGDRAYALFAENLRRFGAGEPLLNVVDKSAGY
jgi:phosphoglycerate dehydrogenase-like enzyme